MIAKIKIELDITDWEEYNLTILEMEDILDNELSVICEKYGYINNIKINIE
jgi:hypothetical protein